MLAAIATAMLVGMAAVYVMAQTTRPADPPLPERTERRIYIAAPVGRVWQALTEPSLSDDWFPFPMAGAEWKVGGKVTFGARDEPHIVWEVLELQPRRRLSVRFSFKTGPPELTGEPPTRLTFELEGMGPTTQLTLTHDEFDGAPMAAVGSGRIWDSNLSRLKTRLETGKPLVYSYEEARQQAGEKPSGPPEELNPLAYVRQITLYVPSLDEARPWYEKVFDLPLQGFSRDWIMLAMGVPGITVKEADSAYGEEAGRIMLSFGTRYVDRLYERLRDAGVTFVQPLRANKYVKEFAFVSPEGVWFKVQGPARPPATRPASRPAERPADGQNPAKLTPPGDPG
jgi:uncharacterized protein YndB with AHSA1/START domain